MQVAFGSSVLTHKKEQQIKIAGEFKPTVDSKKREFQYDFCFVGTAHPKKYKFIQMMTRQLKEVYTTM